jgi:hypothetical protein
MMDPKLKMDVPPQVREFAQKSVDQAERAISSFMDCRKQFTSLVRIEFWWASHVLEEILMVEDA